MYLSKFDDQSSEEISVNVTGKMIVQKNISKIPLKLPYICGTIKEQVKNIYDSKIVDTDLLKIGINNGYQQVISGPMAYISTIMVGYVPNKESYRLAMDGNTAAAEQLAVRTKMDCITHTIFLAGGAFLEPIVNGFMRIPFVQRLIGSISGAVWELNNKVIASSELYQRYLLKQYAKEEVAKVCGYEVSKKISPELLDSIFKSGQASDIVAILSKYDDEAIVAINKILDKDAVATLIRDYGDDGVKVAVKGGNNLVGALAKLDDAALERFMGIASKQDREFFKLFENCDRFTDDLISLVNKKGGINFNEVEIHGIINTEIDEIDFATKVIYEDKNARGLYIENPDVPQTETQWANKQILKKGENRIKALSQNEFSVYIDGEEYSFLSSELKDVRSYVFRINADTPELRIDVDDCLEQLRILYPDYNFSAVYGLSLIHI